MQQLPRIGQLRMFVVWLAVIYGWFYVGGLLAGSGFGGEPLFALSIGWPWDAVFVGAVAVLLGEALRRYVRRMRASSPGLDPETEQLWDRFDRDE